MLSHRTTLADIARHVGVHTTTVSLALRNHPRIPAATRDRIKAVARELNYHPDPLLQALVAYRTRKRLRENTATLAYITNWSTRFGWQSTTAHPQFFAGAQAKATELGYKLDHFWLGEPGLTSRRLNQILLTRAINGLILASHLSDPDKELQLDWPRFSAVKIDCLPHQPVLHNISNDQRGIARLAVQRARAAGYRRIGFVMHRGWDQSCDSLWTAGFLGEQAQMDPKDHVPMLLFPEAGPCESWTRESRSNVVVATPAFERWFQQHRPEVIVSKASFVEPCLTTLGISVPDCVAFVDLFVEDATGWTAGVRQNHAHVGERAVEILAMQLQQGKFGMPPIATTTFVSGTWIDGISCPARTSAEASAPIPEDQG
jgi:LacI family transcriptional regulator